MQNRHAFIDFLKGLLQLNPLERWSPQQARSHPFVTGEKYVGPFVPPARRPVTAGAAGEGGALRPRANTISSSQIDRQNVPPQLQRLVALSSSTATGARRGAGEPPADDVTEDEEDPKPVFRGKSVDSHRPKFEHPPASGEGWQGGNPPTTGRDVVMEDVVGGETLSTKVAQMDIQTTAGAGPVGGAAGVGNSLAMAGLDGEVPRSRRDTDVGDEIVPDDLRGDVALQLAVHPPGTFRFFPS